MTRLFTLLGLAAASHAHAGPIHCAEVDLNDLVTALPCAMIASEVTRTPHDLAVSIPVVAVPGLTLHVRMTHAVAWAPAALAIDRADGTTSIITNGWDPSQEVAPRLAGQEGEDFWGMAGITRWSSPGTIHVEVDVGGGPGERALAWHVPEIDSDQVAVNLGP